MSSPTPSLEYSMHFRWREESADLVSDEQVPKIVVIDIYWVDMANLGSTIYSVTISIGFIEYFSSLAVLTISGHIGGILSGLGYSAAQDLLALSTLMAKAMNNLSK